MDKRKFVGLEFGDSYVIQVSSIWQKGEKTISAKAIRRRTKLRVNVSRAVIYTNMFVSLLKNVQSKYKVILSMCTRVTLKLLTPLGVLDTGWNKKICLWQREEGRLNWQKKRESRSAVSKHGDRGGFKTGLWPTDGANCTHLINQSMTASSRRKAIVLPKNVPDFRFSPIADVLHWTTQDRGLN